MHNGGNREASRQLREIFCSVFPLCEKNKYYPSLIFGPVHMYLCSCNQNIIYVTFSDEEKVSRSELESLPRLKGEDLLNIDTGNRVRGVILTLKGENEYDFISRYFSPWNGIPEDPVTGSAHTVLGPYWSGVLSNKKEMLAKQCYPGRGGEVKVDLRDTQKDGKVRICGESAIVLEGMFYL